MTNGRTLFGTSGIRGDAEKIFTNQFCFDLGRAFDQFLKYYRQFGPVAVGMDPRTSSPRILDAFQQGLGYGGREIRDEGGCPIPAINYLLIVSDVIGGVEVTGSHIASNLNGIKFFAFKEEILKDQENEISRLYFEIKNKIPFKKRKIIVHQDNGAVTNYKDMLINLGGKLPNWRVVVDPGNGAQSGVMSDVLKRIGLKVIAINDQLQGEFMSRDTEKDASFLELQKTVTDNKADLGIGFDADGDRVVFVDEKGNFIPGDYTGSLISKFGDTPIVVTPINTSQVVNFLGKPIVRTRVGSPYVVSAMKENKATFGFEANGGGISAEIMFSRDGGSTAIKILKIMKNEKKLLGELIGRLPKYFIFRTKVDCPTELNSVIIKRAKKEFLGKIEDLDGLKIWIDESSWLLFRPSSNAPEFRVFAEAKTREVADQLGKKGIRLVEEVIKENL